MQTSAARGSAAALLCLAIVWSAACESQTPPSPGADGAAGATDPAALSVGLLNELVVRPGVLAGGQPTDAQLEALKAKGFRAIINLRTAEEGAREEGQKVARLGMLYVPIPVTGLEDLTAENARALQVILNDPAARPALVHCKSGNRVGGLFAVLAKELEGASAMDALEVGRRSGLTKLEPELRQRFGLPATATPAPAPGS